jgi:hypothetical protein
MVVIKKGNNSIGRHMEKMKPLNIAEGIIKWYSYFVAQLSCF